MRLDDLFLCAYESIGEDEYYNPIKRLVKIGDPVGAEGRFTSWTKEDIQVEGRDVTKHTRKVITTADLDECEAADKILFEGQLYSIKEVRGDDYTRWRLLIVDKHGNDPDELFTEPTDQV